MSSPPTALARCLAARRPTARSCKPSRS
jgi:hypothetical protein